MAATTFYPELGEQASNTIILSHSIGDIWEAFWTEADSEAADTELKRLKIKPVKSFKSTAEDYRNPWEGAVKSFTVARLKTKQVDKLIASSKLAQMELAFD